MNGTKTQFEVFLEEEIQLAKGVCFPVKTGFVRRLLTRKAECTSLHPNPDDEFCKPGVGPNYRIISEYQQQFLTNKKMSQKYEVEPLVVERMHPSGYRIINGHHRWAAALQIGESELPIRIVNLMHEDDLRKILENSTHTKRAVLDLDEVIIRTEENGPLEKPLSFPWNRLYSERIRLGVPALFHFLAIHGYDIWLYSAKYYSIDTIQNYFRRYHVEIAGIMTAVEKRQKEADEIGKKLGELIKNKYLYTIHIDNDSVIQIFSVARTFREFPLSGDSETWSQEIMNVVEALEKPEEDRTEP